MVKLLKSGAYTPRTKDHSIQETKVCENNEDSSFSLIISSPGLGETSSWAG